MILLACFCLAFFPPGLLFPQMAANAATRKTAEKAKKQAKKQAKKNANEEKSQGGSSDQDAEQGVPTRAAAKNADEISAEPKGGY